MFVGAKTLKLKVRNYSNFTITFPNIWRCAGDFFKVLLKFKMAATDQLHFFLLARKLKKIVRLIFIFVCGRKTKKLKAEIIHILQSHYPPSWW